jgi:hypothetical protein
MVAIGSARAYACLLPSKKEIFDGWSRRQETLREERFGRSCCKVRNERGEMRGERSEMRGERSEMRGERSKVCSERKA